jgi:predicted  nucleic acid-binding Zn-ribbon protein
VHPHVKKLLALQSVDQEVASLTKDIDSLPAEEAKRRKKLDELDRIAAEAKARVNKTELDSRALDKAVRGNDEEIKKLNERLNLVRNNAEYQATLFQIEAVRKDRDVTQEECLKLLEAVEVQRTEAAAVQATADAERKVFDAFLAEAGKLRSSRAGAIAAVRERRKAMAEGIPDDLLREYDGLFKTRDRLGVCAVEGGFCQGCYNKITMNDTARLMGGSTVVKCGSCQRILYLNR